MSNTPALKFTYRNYRGEVAERTATPLGVRFGASVHHAKPQWLLVAFCHDRQAERSFAMCDILSISGSVALVTLDTSVDCANWKPDPTAGSTE